MDDVTVARALHIFSIVLWIGGIGFVTTVLLPSVRRFKAPHERIGQRSARSVQRQPTVC